MDSIKHHILKQSSKYLIFGLTSVDSTNPILACPDINPRRVLGYKSKKIPGEYRGKFKKIKFLSNNIPRRILRTDASFN